MNLEQLNAMTDLELDEAVALTQGLKEATEDNDRDMLRWFKRYHPTANTTEGKAQAFDLMVKYGLNIDIRVGYIDFISTETSYTVFIDIYDASLGRDLNVSRAIVIAAILSAQKNR